MTLDRTTAGIVLLLGAVAAAGLALAGCGDEAAIVPQTDPPTEWPSATVVSGTEEPLESSSEALQDTRVFAPEQTKEPEQRPTETPGIAETPSPTVMKPQEDPTYWRLVLLRCERHEEPFELFRVRLDEGLSILDIADDPALHPCLGETREARVHSIWSLVVSEDGAQENSEGVFEDYAIAEGEYLIPLRVDYMDQVRAGEAETSLDHYAVTPTPLPSPTPGPVFVTLGSPFAADCGDGIPRIWANDSYNGRTPADYDSRMDEHHGHVDIFVPLGCNIFGMEGEVIAPADGYITTYDKGVMLYLAEGTLPSGIDSALRFIGISSPDLAKVRFFHLMIAHMASNGTVGQVEKGTPIGDVVPVMGHHKLAYQAFFQYGSMGYVITPTLLEQEGGEWPCVPGSQGDCHPEAADYGPAP